MRAVGIQALAVHLPEGVRTNSWWDNHDSSSQEPSKSADMPLSRRYANYDAAMAPYLNDPFFGSVERRVAVNNESSVSLGVKAATKVLQSANILAQDIDCLIATSMFSDRIGSGDAGYLAQALGTSGGAFNIEATCGGSMTALLTACSWVQAGLKERILVITTSRLSRAIEDDDVTMRLCGDASAAFIVGEVPEGYGLLAAESLHTGKHVEPGF